MSAPINNVRQQKGFTLIEILTVVFLVTVVLGGVTVFFTQDSPETKMTKAVERFVVISDHVSELAILGGEPVGLMLEPPAWRENPLDQGWRYHWQKMTAQGWAEMEGIPPVDFDNNIELSVFIDEQEWEYENAPEERVPLVAFYPSGEVTPFEIEFTHEQLPGEIETVHVNVWGSVVWKEREEELEEEDRDKF
ncbi:type II secretion system minor pseudopilin GspH [Agarilytica rhodophyticola]|uniref:type II secretion system minor pseudopilin GspH n=1 Tax=Agarilytica rhodophyticola TaxID=1737490 RepID=UPI000B348747|nr:type II secretion system minor pseudopilin GspH [Agarilytica rhodophyticola]